MRKDAPNKAGGNGSKSLEERLAELERLVDTDPKMRARRLGLNPNLLSPEEFVAVHPDGFRGTISVPDADPLTPREANVYARHEPVIAEAEEKFRDAQAAYDVATAAWHAAVGESRRAAGEAADYKFTAHGELIVPPTSPLYAARAKEAEALEARTDAERVLDKARLHHANLVTKRDHALHAARNEPGLLQQIRDKVLG